MKLNYKILKDLCNIYSPSGYEDNMIKYIVDNVKTNPNFAYITTKKKSVIVYNKIYNPKVETIMIDSHIDQVHLKVVKILDNGMVIALPIGFDGLTTDGLKLIHLKSNKMGVVNINPPHLNIERRTTNEVYIDFGLNEKSINKDILIGDYIMFKSDFNNINTTQITGTGLDNKVSIFILLELIKKLKKKCNYNLIFHFSSREETGFSNISLLFNSIKIDHIKNINEIITLDTIYVTNSTIIPDLSAYTSEIFDNKGPVITRNSDDDVALGDSFILLSSEFNIPIQIAYTGDDNGGSNNSLYSKYTDSYTQMIGIPLKYMHSPNETIYKSDIYNSFLLLWKYINWD